MNTIFGKSFWISVIACTTAFAGGGIHLEARGPYLVAADVYINNQGPFRFLLDTGAQSCAIRPDMAARLGVPVTGRVHHVSPVGSGVAATGMLRSVALGPAAASGIEVLITDLPAVRQFDPTVDGVLGQSFLDRFDYLLDYKGRRFVAEPQGVRGVAVAFERSDGRMAVDVEAIGETRKLVIDSGAPAVVLFGNLQRQFRKSRRHVALTTNSGDRQTALTREKVRIGHWTSKGVQTALLAGSGPGLLPASLFDALYVNNRKGYVILNPAR